MYINNYSLHKDILWKTIELHRLIDDAFEGMVKSADRGIRRTAYKMVDNMNKIQERTDDLLARNIEGRASVEEMREYRRNLNAINGDVTKYGELIL